VSALRVQLAWHSPPSAGEAFSLELETTFAGDRITAICGPSGCGKTTLLDCIAGLRNPAEGSEISLGDRVWVGPGEAQPAHERRIGYVFHDAQLFPHLSVAGNIDYAARRAPCPSSFDTASIAALFGLEALLAAHPPALSAGQRQRVAMARSLAANPCLLLLDEPLANLDAGSSRTCLDALRKIHEQTGLPMLYVSHDIEEVCEIAEDLVLLESGRCTEQGSLLDLAGRLDTRLASEPDAAAILEGSVAATDQEFGLTHLEVGGSALWINRIPDPPGSTRRVRIPARDVSVCREQPVASSILNVLPVVLEELQPVSDSHVMLRLGLSNQHLLARITRRSAHQLALAPGDHLFAQIKSTALLGNRT
jgi:molybdate transport system ATP-binding protein